MLITKNQKILLITLGFILFLIGMFFLLSKSPLIKKATAITSLSPASNSQNVGFLENIEIEFDQTLDSSNKYFLQSNPLVNFSLKIDNKKLIFTHKEAFKPFTFYNLTLTQEGEEKSLANWSFTTQNVQNDSQLIEGIKRFNNQFYPLLEFMPIRNNDYAIVYTDKLKLKIIIYNPNVEVTKQKILNFIQSKNIDPKTHEISYLEIIK